MSFRLAFATAFTATAGGHAGSVAGSRHVAGRIIGAYRIGVAHAGRCGSVDIAGICGIADAGAVAPDGIAS